MYSKVILSVNALVAQMVERKTLNLVVVGSSPTEGVFFYEAQNGRYFEIEPRTCLRTQRLPVTLKS